jgi:HEAT repeat protein
MGRPLGRAFEHLVLVDLMPSEKNEFVHRWCELTEQPDKRRRAEQQLIADIHSADRIERLTGNPMLLTAMALVKRKVGKLPQRRATLYWEAFDLLLNWNPKEGGPIDEWEAVPQLEYLAYAMCDKGIQQLPEQDVVALFECMRREFPNLHDVRKRSAVEFLKTLEARTGILNQAGYVQHGGASVPVYEFRHLSFQEFLASKALVDACFPGKLRDTDKLSDYVVPLAERIASAADKPPDSDTQSIENWREVLRLVTTMCKNDEVDPVIKVILGTSELDRDLRGSLRAAQAALCLADEPNISDTMATSVIESLVKFVHMRARGLIIPAVYELSRTRWRAQLSSALIDAFCEEPASNRPAYAALVGIAESGHIEETANSWAQRLCKMLQHDERSAIQGALGLSAYMPQRDRVTLPRYWYFHRPEDMFASSQIREILRSSQIPDLLCRLLQGNTAMVDAAGLALETSYLLKAWRPAENQCHAMLMRLATPTGRLATAAIARILGAERIQEAVEPLISLLDRRKEPDIVTAVVSALGELKDARSLDPVIRLLGNADWRVRQAAAQALGEIRSERAVDGLLGLMQDDDSDVRSAVATALGQIKAQRTVEPLLRLLEDSEWEVLQAAVQALGEIRSERAIDGLVHSLRDEDSYLQETAGEMLGKIGTERCTKALTLLLDADDSHLRSVAVGGLAQTFDQVERRLLSRDFDSIQPYIDPREPIATARIREAASSLGLNEDHVRGVYRKIAERLRIQLVEG